MSNPRIIAGTARGIRLADVPGNITRPITDRVKEALFNIVGTDIVDSSFLDLFGGTGSVGIEALSRGASFARFLDLHHSAAAVIQENLKRTRLQEKAEVLNMDAFAFLRQPPNRAFDYIYIAPPQYKEMWTQTLKALDANPAWLSADGWIIAQIDPVEYSPLECQYFAEFEQRRYGSTLLVFYERKLTE